jgi:hypothetical protein
MNRPGLVFYFKQEMGILLEYLVKYQIAEKMYSGLLTGGDPR